MPAPKPVALISALAMGLVIALGAACGAPSPDVPGSTDAGPTDTSTVTRADLEAVNTDNPTRADLITVCMFEQYTYAEADCACAADIAFDEYSPLVRRLLVMDGGGAFEASPETLELLATLDDTERNQYASHGFYAFRKCTGRTVPE